VITAGVKGFGGAVADSGVAIGWAGCAKSHASRGPPSSRLKKILKNNFPVTVGDLQILCCELHKNAFGGRALPGPAGVAMALPQAP